MAFDPRVTHVAVLKGGWSAEREVSLVSGAACGKALTEEGFRVTELDAGRDVAEKLAALKPDAVFNALHGQGGEDGCIQGVLEILELPYTHSGVLASALAMDKERAKHAFRAARLPCARDVVLDRREAARQHALEPPYVLKPVAQGSSVGVFIVRKGDNRPPDALTHPDWQLGDRIMAEEYIPGRELTVAVMGERALAVTEILPATGFYDYQAKYAEGGSRHVVPAQLPKAVSEEACRIALAAHQVLGCRGVSRTDLRYDDSKGGEGRLVILEVNTQPGMTPTSLVPEQAAYVGISFKKLVRWILDDASCGR
jgi:D-alanine-D-alanine ligase